MASPICKLPLTAINRWWRFQIVIPAYLCTGWNFKEKLEFCRGFSLYPRIDFVRRDREEMGYRVFCFADPEHARLFQEAYDGIPLYPEDRGTGAESWKWNRPLGDVRRKHPLLHESALESLVSPFVETDVRSP